jgi:hypothetical protein
VGLANTWTANQTFAAAITGTTIDATTDFTIGDTVITDGVITDSTGLQVAAAVDMANNAISNVGAAGNDWTTNALTLAGGTAAQILTVETTGGSTQAELYLKVPASNDGHSGIFFRQGDGSGSANNMEYLLYYDASAGSFNLRSRDINGSSTDGNIWQVADGTNDINFLADVEINGALNHDGLTVGFYGTAPVTKQTSVAVSIAAVHAALVSLGLIAA